MGHNILAGTKNFLVCKLTAPALCPDQLPVQLVQSRQCVWLTNYLHLMLWLAQYPLPLYSCTLSVEKTLSLNIKTVITSALFRCDTIFPWKSTAAVVTDKQITKHEVVECKCRGSQIVGTRSHRQLHCIWLHLMFVGPGCGTCFLSLFWYIHTYIHTHTHTHTYIHTYIDTYIHIYIYTHTHTHIRIHVQSQIHHLHKLD